MGLMHKGNNRHVSPECVELQGLGVETNYDHMRTDARFADLIHKIGLPQ